MINKIRISALKSIDVLEMNCSKLNIITGTNSSGKSTLLQAFLLFYQSYTGSEATLLPANGLNGAFLSLGEFRENKNLNVISSDITIGLNFDKLGDKFAVVDFRENDNLECDVSDYLDVDIEEILCDVSGDLSEELAESLDHLRDDDEPVFNNLKYLSCNRIGAQDVFNKNYSSEGIGQNGEYAIHYFEQNKSKPLDVSIIKDITSETLATQVNYWLNYIVRTTINTEDVKGTDIVKASYSVGEGRNSRPKNVGSGISYLISILILCLSSEKNDILVIENPEIHLHPKAQSRVSEFLLFIAKSGRQIFLETHSDHVFNGIRAGIATGDICNEDVTINYFELDERNCTKNTVIEFGKRGRILNYVEGLFDQFDIDLNKMLNI